MSKEKNTRQNQRRVPTRGMKSFEGVKGSKQGKGILKYKITQNLYKNGKYTAAVELDL
jgi:hypothetical protein